MGRPKGGDGDDGSLSPEDFGVSGQQMPIELGTVSGDIRDILLTHIRSMRVPWSMLSEDEQRDKIDAATKCGEDVARRAVQIVAIGGFPAVVVSVGSVKFDKGVEIKLSAAGIVENIVRLAEHGKQSAVLVLAESANYFGERAAVRPDKQQPGLPLEDAAE